MDTVKSEHGAATGTHGERLLVQGDRITMRLWDEQPEDTEGKTMHRHDYEVVGYVLAGEADLILNGETHTLATGDAYHVPSGAEHTYRVRTPFRAIEVKTT